MITPKATNAFAYSRSAQPRLEVRESNRDSTAVPNFVHVGERPYALEGYLRLYLRDWTERVRVDSIQ